QEELKAGRHSTSVRFSEAGRNLSSVEDGPPVPAPLAPAPPVSAQHTLSASAEPTISSKAKPDADPKAVTKGQKKAAPGNTRETGGRAQRPHAPRDSDDKSPPDGSVSFTIYKPRVVKPLTWSVLLAFAHRNDRPPDALPEEAHPLDRVDEQAREIL